MRFICVLLFLFASTSGWAIDDDALERIVEEYWQTELRADPFSATSAGVSKFNHAVPDVSPEAYKKNAEDKAELLLTLRSLDRSALSHSDELNARLLEFILQHDVALAKFDGWRMPFLADTGFHTDFNYVISATTFSNEDDFEDYIKRLRGFDEYIEQQIVNMRQGLADGFTQPREIMPFILPSFDALVKDDFSKTTYFRPFESMPESISKRRTNALRRKAQSVITDEILPAHEKLATFMREEYLPGARETIGASALPDGSDYYAALVRYYTTLNDAEPADIHELGLKEVARIRGEMSEVIQQTGFDGTFEEFLVFLRTDPQFYAETPQDLLERAAWLAKDIDGKLPAFFGKLPRQPYSVEPVPSDIAPNYTTGRYVGAPADGERGGQYWVNTYALDKRPLYQLAALTLHEATPGHHLQGALSLEIENVPAFRNQFYPHAFGEGWGLYAEKLGVEMDVYQTPYDDFGRLSYEMWRACRLVIDTGLHSKGWTRKQAMDYLASNTALSEHNVQTEIDRYISWPGQALAYKIGELTIWELRHEAEKKLGEDFDIRTFHDAVLAEGGLPLEILREEIDRYIEASQ